MVKVHAVGLVCDHQGEILLRQISESNNGDFVIKKFHRPGDAERASGPEKGHPDWRNELVNETSQKMTRDFQQQKFSLGGQLKIVEVMTREVSGRQQGWRD